MENLFDFRLLTSAVQNNDGNNSDYKFDVVKFDGHEHISELYHFNVLLAVHNVDDYQQLVNLLLKSRVVLTLHYKMNFDRNICGICENVAVIGESHERLYVNVRIVPAISVLKHDARSRVFLNKSVPEIINQVFQEETRKYGPVLFKTQLLDMSGYPKEEIVTQFNESNWDFVNRLMEKVGLLLF